ncbi:MAG: helix-turn-helix domain-containing protein [Armatimonadota bacterium]
MAEVDCPDWKHNAWMAEVRPHEHHIDRFQPLWATANMHLEPTPLSAHMHRGLEIGVVLAGEQEVRFGDSAMAVRAGEVWLVSMWEPHAWRISRPQTHGLAVIFVPELAEEIAGPDLPWLSMFTASPSQRPRVTSAEAHRHIEAIGRDLYLEIESRPVGWSAGVRVNLVRLLLALYRDWTPEVADATRAREQANYLTRVIPALTLINSRPGHRVTWREAADACRLSASRFNAVFRQAMGLSFERCCLQSRLHYAAHLLLSTGLSVEAIADQTDFADASHLHHAFRRHYRCRPAEYRRSRGHAHKVLVG